MGASSHHYHFRHRYLFDDQKQIVSVCPFAAYSETSIYKHVQKKDTDDNSKGIISSFEAVSTAVGGSVGVANIGGVSTAIAVGGPGAVFWMWVCALFGMIIKTVEVTLSVHYRNTDENGDPYGGPTYYMEKGLGEEKKKFYLLDDTCHSFRVRDFITFFSPCKTTPFRKRSAPLLISA